MRSSDFPHNRALTGLQGSMLFRMALMPKVMVRARVEIRNRDRVRVRGWVRVMVKVRNGLHGESWGLTDKKALPLGLSLPALLTTHYQRRYP